MFVTKKLQEQVNEILNDLDVYAEWLEACAARTGDWENDVTIRWAAERALHIAVECATDAANVVIDALVMRDPGGYSDIIRVLMEEGVVHPDWFRQFEGALELRNRLIHQYTDIQAEEIRLGVTRYAPLFKEYAAKLREYLAG